MAEPFDPSAYQRPPVLNTASGYALACALISAMPSEVPDMIRRTAEAMHSHARALQVAWIAQEKSASTVDRRGIDLWLDLGWSAIVGRLDSYATLPKDKYPLAVRAAEIRGILLAKDGLAFVNLPYDEEWAESAKRISKITEQGLGSDLDRICGPEFQENLLAAHEAYGKVAGTTQKLDKVEKALTAEPLRNLQIAIGRYGRQWAAAAEDSPELMAKAQVALAPIDRLRARQTPAGTPVEPEADLDPSNPLPDLPVPPVTG